MCSLSEEQFNSCYSHQLWGANNGSVKSWDIGDRLIFKVGNQIVAVAKVDGEPYMDDTEIWDNGLFYYRVQLKFEKVLERNERIPFEGEIKEAFIKQWGRSYGWVILNKYPMSADISNMILAKMLG
jgi:hypothetical protein